MNARSDEPPSSEPPEPIEDDFTISRSNALVPLLVLFAATVLAIFWIIVRAKPFVPPEGAPAEQAFGPHDFPAVFGKDDALAGLEEAFAASGTALVAVPPPPFSEGVFPCMDCHADLAPNRERRSLKLAHTEIVLRHDEEHRWCLDCHDAEDRNHLRLASGALVEFTESYRLCGQCHGTQYRDWKTGIHGKRTGYWAGPRRYLLCVHCHDPHSPRFRQLVPLPPPIRPQFLRPRGGQATVATAPAGVSSVARTIEEADHLGRAR